MASPLPVAERSRSAARADDGSTPSRITCEWCGKKLTGRQRRFCCREHDELQSGRRKVQSKRVCPVDGVVFEAAGNKRFCSDQCGKAYENAKARGTLDQLLARGRVGAPPYDCAQCGKHCIPGQNVPPQASRFCHGTRCKHDWHRDNDPTGRERERAAEQAAEALLASFLHERLADRVAYVRAVRADPCCYCAAASQALDHIIPRCDGGEDDWTNRTAACHSCNSTKQSSPLLIYLAWRAARAEFEPWRALVAAIHTRTPQPV